ncbi:uncharacterized protein METZ01_LOCUS282164 [marine metagenome]|uniref:Uncharacterized protein n=1 Tax=marine metagenome TaxID=408172 RepID=A0A382KXW4_9ZZZZ
MPVAKAVVPLTKLRRFMIPSCSTLSVGDRVVASFTSVSTEVTRIYRVGRQ